MPLNKFIKSNFLPVEDQMIPLEFNTILNTFGYMLLGYNLALTLTVPFSYYYKLSKPVLNDIFQWIISYQRKLALYVFLLIFYFDLVRGQNLVEGSYSVYVDWIIIIVFSLIIFSNFWRYLKDKTSNLIYSDKSKHEKTVNQYYQEDLTELENIQKEFVENRRKEIMIVTLTRKLINSSGIDTDKEASRILFPLINYQDVPIPNNAPNWWKKRIRRKNKEERKKVLNKTIRRIKNHLMVDKDFLNKLKNQENE